MKYVIEFKVHTDGVNHNLEWKTSGNEIEVDDIGELIRDIVEKVSSTKKGTKEWSEHQTAKAQKQQPQQQPDIQQESIQQQTAR